MSAYVRTTGSQKLPSGRWVHAFSQSMLSTFQHCPEQARAIYMREVESTDTDSTSLGRACHEGFEYALLEKMQGRKPTIDDMIAVVRHDLDQMEWRYTKMSRATVYDLVDPLMDGFFHGILPNVEPHAVEQKFSVLLYGGKHRDVYMNGTIDCIDDSGDVWDWKTASRPYERWEKQRWAVQPTVYTYAVDAMMIDDALRTGYPDEIPPPLTDEATFRYGIVQYDGTAEIMEVTRNHTHLSWLREQCSQIAWLIENNVKPWPLMDAGWHCSPRWCPKFDACKGAHGIEEGWTS